MLGAVILVTAMAAPPLAIRAEVAPLGRGEKGTVVGVALQVAPEDRQRAGERVRVAITLVRGNNVIDSSESVVTLAADGSALVYRDWPVGDGEARVLVESLDGAARGGWSGKISVTTEEKPFEAPAGAGPEAVALAAPAPAEGVVHFHAPGGGAGIGAVELRLDVPSGTTRVEYYQDGKLLFSKARPPWTVSVPLGEVARKSTVRAAAFGAGDVFLGEDAVVLNGPANQIAVTILLAPEIKGATERVVTVSVGKSGLSEVALKADDRPIARWTSCPCVARIANQQFAGIKVLSAEAKNNDGLRGEAVQVLGTTGFSEAVKVEIVELPVTVFDRTGKLIVGLGKDAFRVSEEGKPVQVESFAATADLPLSLGILVDTSGSMKQTFPAVRTAVSGFAASLLRPGDRFFVMTFSFEPTILVTWTADSALLEPALEHLEPDGGTSLNDALVRSLELFRGTRGRSAIVLLSDGDDTTSRTPWDAALRFARTMRTPIFTIGFRIGLLDFGIRERLKQLAHATGADVFFAGHGELKDVYKKIDEQLRAQYLLTYRSSSTSSPDTFRQVRVEVAGEGLTARTIAGYYAAQ
jgi:VWFA-related protein